MRDMSRSELDHFYSTGQCPACGINDWYYGPTGGMCRNIKCAGCGAKYNVIDPDTGCNMQNAPGQVLSESPIQMTEHAHLGRGKPGWLERVLSAFGSAFR